MRKLFLTSFFVLLSLCANAYDFLEVDGIYYKITSDNTAEVNRGNEAYTGDIVIPNSIKITVGVDEIEFSVTRIDEWAFHGCNGLTSIRLPENLAYILDDAFYGCSSLTSIDIPSSVTSIGNYAFDGCSSLTSINIPEGVTSIGEQAFCGCSGLTSIDIPSSVISIGEHAFRGCRGLTSINIPINVTNIGYGLLNDCQTLTTITVASGNSVYDSHNNCNAIIETSTNTLIQGCDSTVIPESVTKIGDYAFYNCNLKSLLSTKNC